MRAVSLKIHNFRSIIDAEISLSPYTLLVGANNSGKSNIIDAIRIFYEKDIKFDENRDFPKTATNDNETWIEIQYLPSDDERNALKSEYILQDETFIVRKYLKSSELDDDNKPKSGIYAYVGGSLSSSRFYGAKNIQQGKLGDIVYIPAVSKLDEYTKLSGPSALRDLINLVLKQIIDSSPSYNELIGAFDNFSGRLKNEAATDGKSLAYLENEISKDIAEWGTSFELNVNPVKPEDIVKTLIEHRVKDNILGQTLDPKCYGQGFQRHLVFTLIKLSSKLITEEKSTPTNEFSPKLNWILFEEPEAFLHPSQIEILDASLRQLSNSYDGQVTISTHNPLFINKNINSIPSIIRLFKNGPVTEIKQISSQRLDDLFKQNQNDFNNWIAAGIDIHRDDLEVDMESIKYSLWLDPKRCSIFFSNKVLIVEGPTEVALFSYLIGQGYISRNTQGLFILDALCKFNIHRFMNLLGLFGIPHGVLFDNDNGKYPLVTNTIRDSINNFTTGVDCFPVDLETFLDIPKAGSPHRKPQHVMWQLHQGRISRDKILAVSKIVERLLE